ncbi:MAG: ATP-dependent protease ATPase subunit HslU [Bacteroidota bacterium]
MEYDILMTPSKVVTELDRHIVGQDEAKRAVAIALRNRTRRQRLPEALREEILPKSILMIGPTGVGKTEIARRLAKLANAPFIKVEATKFTEVGYVGRDVDSIIRDLVERAVRDVREEKVAVVAGRTTEAVEERLLDAFAPRRRRESHFNPLGALFGLGNPGPQREAESQPQTPPGRSEDETGEERRQELRRALRAGELEDEMVEIEITDNSSPPFMQFFAGAGMEEVGMNLQDMFGGLLPPRHRRRRVTVSQARRLLTQEEAEKLINPEEVTAEAIRRVEQSGIVFLDEIDKIAGREATHGPDVSREGVQRDLLPIVEGTTVMTKYGPVRTDHILFIGAGAFHFSKPSDLIPELQGRFPIRVELKALSREDFRRILTEPEHSLTRQYKALLAADGVELEFTEDGIDALADVAYQANEQMENIGARRLYTVMEKLLEAPSFLAPDQLQGKLVVNAEYVRSHLENLLVDRDLARYIL